MEKDLKLVGDIIQNWITHGENSQTIAFSPSINHSKTMVKMFNEAGISAEHIDGYMDDAERQILYREHDEGKFKILSCSRLLNTGYDAPSVRCLIDAFPTKSLSSYVQRVGRVLRLHKDKPHAIILDHAGNVAKHGFAEDVVPDTLHAGEKEYSEREQTKEKKEPKTMDCPECFQTMIMPRCACGYEVPRSKMLESDKQILTEIKREDKGRWLYEFQYYAAQKKYKPGWASWAYKSKFGVFPRITAVPGDRMPEVQGYVKHLQIKRAKNAGSNFRKAG
jgi:DNA repair protein RadD